MSEGFWNDDEDFRDIPDEVNEGEQAPPAALPARQRTARPAAPAGPVVEDAQVEESEEGQEQEDDDYSEVLHDARLRLEQGRLYEMIMKHNLFDGVDSDPKAVKAVQKEIVKFAKERMEIMLGMRSEDKPSPGMVSSPFNSLEVQLLKNLAFQMSQGKTATEEAEQIADKIAPKKEGLKAISARPSGNTAPKKLAQAPAAPIKRAPPKKQPQEQVKDDGYRPLEKPIHEMTEDELIQRNKESARRQRAKAVNPAALPLPTIEQEEALHSQRALQSAGAVSTIVALLNQNKKK